MSVIDHDDLGEVIRKGDTASLVFRRRYDRPVEKVWAALTVPERIADWFAQVTFSDGQIELYFPEVNHRAKGRVTAWEPMRLVEWTWPQPDADETVVRFELEPDGDGCRLTLTESGLTPKQAAGNGAGWHAHLQGLEAATDGVATPWSKVIERERLVNEAYKRLSPA